MMSIEDFKDLLEIDEDIPGEDDHYETIAGFVMMQQGRIAKTGDHFQWNNLRFEVVDMDGHRIDKILVMRQPQSLEDQSNDVS